MSKEFKEVKENAEQKTQKLESELQDLKNAMIQAPKENEDRAKLNVGQLVFLFYTFMYKTVHPDLQLPKSGFCSSMEDIFTAIENYKTEHEKQAARNRTDEFIKKYDLNQTDFSTHKKMRQMRRVPAHPSFEKIK